MKKKFIDLKAGDMFRVPQTISSAVFIRLNETAIYATEEDSGDEFMNSVNIFTGELARFEDDQTLFLFDVLGTSLTTLS